MNDAIEALKTIRKKARELELIPELRGQLIHDASFKLAQGTIIQFIDELLCTLKAKQTLETPLFSDDTFGYCYIKEIEGKTYYCYSNKEPEPMIKVSELREWCEDYLTAIGHKQHNKPTIREATVIYDLLARFCGGEK